MVWRVVLVTITAVAMTGVLVVAGLVLKNRHRKEFRASTPSLLLVVIFGFLPIYSEALVTSFPVSPVTCMLRPWVRHIGFAITYGALLIKTWRISVIMCVFKARIHKTNDAALHKKNGIIVGICACYLLVWTAVDPNKPDPEGIGQCPLNWWEISIDLGEILMLCWGGYLCFRAHKAPEPFNETRQISHALWNETLWTAFYIFIRYLIQQNPSSSAFIILHFVRAHGTVTATVLVLFAPKFHTLYKKGRLVRGTITEVYGESRIHRLSLVINQAGEIKTVYCVPCGPLAYLNAQNIEYVEEEKSNAECRETQYTKAEVDRLIEMVSRLKDEGDLLKNQYQKLAQYVRGMDNKGTNGLALTVLPTLPELESPQPVERRCDKIIPETHRKRRRTSLSDSDGIHCRDNFLECSGKSSTVTTYLSSTPDASVTNTSRDATVANQNYFSTAVRNDESDVMDIDKADDILKVEKLTNTIPLNGYLNVCPSNGCEQYDPDDFPKLLRTHENKYPNKMKETSLAVSTVCNEYSKNVENRDKPHNNKVIDTPQTEGLTVKDKSSCTSKNDMENFVMYI